MRIRYKIESDGQAPRFVTPYSGKDLKLTWNREDERKYDFKKELKEITLLRDDYKYFYELENSNDRCDQQTLTVILDCNGNEADYHTLFEGTFSMSSGQWDLDRCTVKFEIETLDPYSCIEENDDEHNILQLPDPQTVNLNITIGIEYYLCCTTGCSPECNQQTLDAGLWTFYKERELIFDIIKRLYLRQYLLCPCDYEPSEEWTLLEACSNDQKKYIRPYVTTDTELFYINSEFEVNDNSIPVSEIDNGRKLLDVMQSLLDLACPDGGLTIVSDLFQWNPENPSNINYITQKVNELTNIIIFQKSDVKRPTNSNNATKGEINFIDLLEQICKTLNCGYEIIDDQFRIEHIKYFESDLGIDLLANDKNKLLNGTKKHSYDSTKLPKYEKFQFMEAGSADFVGKDIVYSSACVNNHVENKSNTVVDNITTDVMHCLENPDPDSDVSDDGFVLIACDENNNVLYEDGILEVGTTVNNVLGWAHLHQNYWKHGRVLQNGEMNGVETDFLSTVPVIKQESFNFIMQCDLLQIFNPLDKLRSALGWGFLQSAELKLSQCAMKIELLLEEKDISNNQQLYGDFDGDFSAEFD